MKYAHTHTSVCVNSEVMCIFGWAGDVKQRYI